MGGRKGPGRVKVGSLFSGIGGRDLGLERAGMKVVWQVEKDPYCQKVLKKHWPEVPCYGDIKEIDFTTLPPVDLLCGGFPCQPVSCAGKRQGDKDERWLWPEFYRAVCEIRPQWALAENVPGLLSADSGKLFGGVLRDLASIGYDVVWDLLPAAAFGAPHLRYRLFIIAHLDPMRQLQPNWSIFNVRERPVYSDWWTREPGIPRVVHGVPNQMDRIECLGNAVVPQIAEWIGRKIMEATHDR